MTAVTTATAVITATAVVIAVVVLWVAGNRHHGNCVTTGVFFIVMVCNRNNKTHHQSINSIPATAGGVLVC